MAQTEKMQAIVSYQDLQRMCRPKGSKPRLATVEAWATKQGIRYKYDGAGGIWTTMEAVNVALGISAANDDDAPADPALFGQGT